MAEKMAKDMAEEMAKKTAEKTTAQLKKEVTAQVTEEVTAQVTEKISAKYIEQGERRAKQIFKLFAIGTPIEIIAEKCGVSTNKVQQILE